MSCVSVKAVQVLNGHHTRPVQPGARVRNPAPGVRVSGHGNHAGGNVANVKINS